MKTEIEISYEQALENRIQAIREELITLRTNRKFTFGNKDDGGTEYHELYQRILKLEKELARAKYALKRFRRNVRWLEPFL